MNRTAHYGLPLFEATDKPSILVDWNETMAELDNALFTIATGGDTSVVDAITALQQAVASINSQITIINQTLGDTLDVTFMNNIAPQFEATGVEYNPRDMVFHNSNLYICFTQYTGIQDDEEHFDQYFIPVWLAEKVTDNLNDVDSLKTRMTAAESGISTNAGDISGLDTRVTALENAPAGGSTVYDLEKLDSSDLHSIPIDSLSTIITSAGGGNYTSNGVTYSMYDDLSIALTKQAFLNVVPTAKKVKVFVNMRYVPPKAIDYVSGSGYQFVSPFQADKAYMFEQYLTGNSDYASQILDLKRCELKTPTNAGSDYAFFMGAGFASNYLAKGVTIDLDSYDVASFIILRYVASIAYGRSGDGYANNAGYAQKLSISALSGATLSADVKFQVIE